MAPFFPPGTALTDEQVAMILASPLVQTDPGGQRFIEITPIAIVASEPPTVVLLGGSLGVLVIVAASSRARKPA